jgi:hypothetical protein
MTTIHLFQIETFKSSFNDILQYHYQITEVRSVIKNKLNELKQLYGKLVKRNNKKIYLFCLDSFYFQYKTLAVELDNIQRYITMMNNRIYGDCYKLYHIILVENSSHDTDIYQLLSDFKKYTPYKDLDPFHEYKMSEIIRIHNDILRTLNHLHVRFLKKEYSISEYHDSISSGMSIGNFMQTLSYENTLMKEQLLLYVNYLTFFHKSHNGYLIKLFTRIQSFQNEIDEEILSNNQQTNQENTESISGYLQNIKNEKKDAIEHTLSILESDETIDKLSVMEKELCDQELCDQENVKCTSDNLDICVIATDALEDIIIEVENTSVSKENMTISIEHSTVPENMTISMEHISEKSK